LAGLRIQKIKVLGNGPDNSIGLNTYPESDVLGYRKISQDEVSKNINGNIKPAPQRDPMGPMNAGNDVYGKMPENSPGKSFLKDHPILGVSYSNGDSNFKQPSEYPNEMPRRPIENVKNSPIDSTYSAGTHIDKIADGIAKIETGGFEAKGRDPYSAYTPGRKGDAALGKYQIMTTNLPRWSKEALGKSISTQEFLKSPELQEKIAKFQMNKLNDKLGDPSKVAGAWFGGEGGLNNLGRTDKFGMSIQRYMNKFRGFTGF